MPAIGEIKRNGSTYGLGKTFVITEDMVSISTDSTKGVAPYNESYGYTNITIDDTKGIVRMSGAVYSFFCNSSRVASAYRNVRVRIGTSGTRYPVFTSSTSILGGHSYFVATQTRMFVFKTTTNAVGLHMINDTTYSALTVANITSSNTTAKVVSGSIFNQGVKAVAVNDTAYASSWNGITDVAPSKNAVYDKISAMDTTISGKADSSAIPTKVSDLQNDSGFITSSSLPTVNNNTITIQKNGTKVDDFTLNQSTDKSINITVPTKVSDLNNDSGFITGISSSDITTALGYTPYSSANPNGYTSNTGTITGITMNGSSKGTSGVVDLGTVITDVSGKANTSDVLTKTNTTEYTPTANYHPATKKYVDDAVASAGGGNMECLTTFGTKWRFGTKAMFNALTNKDVNGVYVILSQRDYDKMIHD